MFPHYSAGLFPLSIKFIKNITFSLKIHELRLTYHESFPCKYLITVRLKITFTKRKSENHSKSFYYQVVNEWYTKYFHEISGITYWDINQNISCVVKYPKSFSMGGQRYCKFCVRNIENQNHSLGLDEEIFVQVLVIPWV